MSEDKQEPSSMAEWSGRCRICLIDHGCMTSLQSDRVEAKLKDLTKCTHIDVKYKENLPRVVCHVCLYKLSMWSEFKEQFIQSNKMLLEQLEISETSDIPIKDSSKDESCLVKNVERKRKNGETNISGSEKKKSRLVKSSEVTNDACNTNQMILDTICLISDDNKDKLDISKPKKNAKNSEKDKTCSGPVRTRLLPLRRGKNIERRKASTKRWVERKKALLAATGENVSDTDSIASDDVQLSPVQKARAKTNADKELERQKKIAKVLKNLETNLAEKYIGFRDRDTDSDTRRTRLRDSHSNTLQQRNKNSLLNPLRKKDVNERNGFSLDNSMEREDCPISEMQADDQTFTPQLLKSKVVFGNTTFAITSKLILVDSSNLDKTDPDKIDLNNLTKDSKNLDESNQETNTDIIDAVQLRRINPVTINAKNKSNDKFVGRCLNIEVEGSELAVLKRVQCDLANFIQREIKHKLLDTSNRVAKTNKASDTCQKLDQKLKDIIELAIKKNIEPSLERRGDHAYSQTSTRFSPTLIKKAMNSPKYQPKVIIKRLDIIKESRHYIINNADALKSPRSKFTGPFNMITRKRQSVPPARYDDYNIDLLDSDSEEDDDDDDDDDDDYYYTASVRGTPKTTNSKTSNLSTKQSASIRKPMENSQDKQKADYEEAIKLEGAITENHICGVCGLTFQTRKEVEAHVRNHKLALGISTVQVVLQNENVIPPPKPQQTKQKMMRCKRCHEIVEARFVKAHVCKTSLHKCHTCNSVFRTKNLLTKHLESHDNSEININAIGNKKLNNADPLVKILSGASVSPQKDQTQETETAIKMEINISEKNDIQSDKISSTGVKLDSTESIARKSKETYTCFVCDKIFTDEEVLKDHLQKHCDDLSEGEQSNNKEQYQCAICGNTLESDQALEEHVGKHLFDDEDDNPNLISINQSNEDNKLRENETYQCGQCSETFDSEIMLEMHMQAHEEEVAIAEWEKQGMKVHQYQCILCDELFNTEEQLAEHLDIHNANAQICQLCDKPFHTLEDLQKHVATH